jgi:DedD protein
MNEQIKRRLIGIAVMVLVALAIAAMLPEPRLQPTLDEDVRVVTIPLQEERIVSVPATGDEPARYDGAGSASSPPQIAGDEDTEALSTPAPVATPKPTPRPTATPTATPRPTAPPAATPASTLKLSPTMGPSPATPRPTATATPAATAAPAVPVATAWWVQIGSYADIGNARETEARVAALGQPTVMAPIEAAGTTLYRVRAGPYPSEARAQEAHALITRNVAPEARLIKP